MSAPISALGPRSAARRWVGAPGLEPGTSALSGPRSNRLSYAPAATGRDAPHGTRSGSVSAATTPLRRRSPIRPQRRQGSRRGLSAPPGAPPALCPRRSARMTTPASIPRPRRDPLAAQQQQPSPSPHVASPTSPPSVAPLPGPRPSRDGSASGLGAHRCRIITRRLDKVEGVETPPLPRKEVIQPQLPLRLPCYDFVPITSPALDGCLPEGLAHRLQALPAFVT